MILFEKGYLKNFYAYSMHVLIINSKSLHAQRSPPLLLTLMIFYSFFSYWLHSINFFIISYDSHYICILNPSGYLLFGAYVKVPPFTFNFNDFLFFFFLLVTLHKLFIISYDSHYICILDLHY